MIISFRRNFIFLHARKTAGSSLVAYLSNHLGPRDILLSGAEELLRSGGSLPARIYLSSLLGIGQNPSILRSWRSDGLPGTISKGAKHHFTRSLGPKPQHASAENISLAFPQHWKKSFKFSVVRNPYDRAVSDYFWTTRKLSDPPTFSEHIDALASKVEGSMSENEFHSNWNKYAISGKLVLDYIIRYENLLPDFNDCLEILGLQPARELPTLKALVRIKGRNYREFYQGKTREKVEQLYAKEIEAFRYEF